MLPFLPFYRIFALDYHLYIKCLYYRCTSSSRILLFKFSKFCNIFNYPRKVRTASPFLAFPVIIPLIHSDGKAADLKDTFDTQDISVHNTEGFSEKYTLQKPPFHEMQEKGLKDPFLRSLQESYVIRAEQQIQRLISLQIRVWQKFVALHKGGSAADQLNNDQHSFDVGLLFNTLSNINVNDDISPVSDLRFDNEGLHKLISKRVASNDDMASSAESASGKLDAFTKRIVPSLPQTVKSDAHDSVVQASFNKGNGDNDDSSLTLTELSVLRRIMRNSAATVIQRHVRGILQRRNYRTECEEYRIYCKRRAAAIKIQSLWRGQMGRECYRFEAMVQSILKKRAAAAIIIQRRWRHWLNQSHLEFECMTQCFMRIRQCAACVLQRVWRGYRARCILDEEWEDWVIKWSWDSPGTIVEVVGDFSNPPWKKRYLMTYCNIRNCFVLRLKRKPGQYELKFLVDGRYVCDGGQVVVLDGAGHYNNLMTVGKAVEPPLQQIRNGMNKRLLADAAYLSTSMNPATSFSSNMDSLHIASSDYLHHAENPGQEYLSEEPLLDMYSCEGSGSALVRNRVSSLDEKDDLMSFPSPRMEVSLPLFTMAPDSVKELADGGPGSVESAASSMNVSVSSIGNDRVKERFALLTPTVEAIPADIWKVPLADPHDLSTEGPLLQDCGQNGATHPSASTLDLDTFTKSLAVDLSSPQSVGVTDDSSVATWNEWDHRGAEDAVDNLNAEKEKPFDEEPLHQAVRAGYWCRQASYSVDTLLAGASTSLAADSILRYPKDIAETNGNKNGDVRYNYSSPVRPSFLSDEATILTVEAASRSDDEAPIEFLFAPTEMLHYETNHRPSHTDSESGSSDMEGYHASSQLYNMSKASNDNIASSHSISADTLLVPNYAVNSVNGVLLPSTVNNYPVTAQYETPSALTTSERKDWTKRKKKRYY